MKTVTLPRTVGFGGAFDFLKDIDVKSVTKQVVDGATDYYKAQTAIETAKADSQLARAQAQAAINIAKAGGQNATQVAGVGLPSPTLLLLGGLGLAAILILKR